MSLEQITEKIKNDAMREAEEIKAKAQAQVDAIKKKASDENSSVKASFDMRFEDERPEIFKRREIVANLDVGKMMLGAKREIIEDVYRAVLDKLKNLDKDTYESFFEKLLNQAVETGEEVITLGEEERHINQAWLDAYNQRNGKKLTLAEEKADIFGGFILKDGKTRVNCSWDMLVNVSREKFEFDVVERLFESNG
jgi:V/A-type H+-transporting ATPase subunit E